MNLVLRWLDVLRELSMPLVSELQQLVARVNAWASAEHNTDGTHAFTWKTETFNAGDYSANGGGTWTVTAGQVLANRYTKMGSTVHVSFRVEGTSVNGAGNELRLRIPGGYKAKDRAFTGTLMTPGAGSDTGYIRTGDADNAGANQLRLFRSNDASWPNSNNFNAFGAITLEVKE